MLIKAKPLVEHLRKKTKKWVLDSGNKGRYVAIFLLSDNIASEKYVSLKAAYAKKIWLYADIIFAKNWDVQDILEKIVQCNSDIACLWVMVQLPIGEKLKEHQKTILESIDPKKDIDWLTSKNFWNVWFWYHDILWATPQSALALLDWYDLWDMEGKYVTIIGQSNLIWKRLAVACMYRRATVLSANSRTSTWRLAQMIDMSEIIFSATWVKHIVSKDLMKDDSAWINKVFVDIWWGSDDEWPHWDMDRKILEDNVKAITPVPGWVGPATVASLFHNIIRLSEI